MDTATENHLIISAKFKKLASNIISPEINRELDTLLNIYSDLFNCSKLTAYERITNNVLHEQENTA